MRLVTSLPPALLITLSLFGLMQYLIGGGRPGLERPDYPGFVRLIRVTPDTHESDRRLSAQRLPDRPAPSAAAPAAPPLQGADIEPPVSPALSIALPEQVPLDLGAGPSLEHFDPGRTARDQPGQAAPIAASSQADEPGSVSTPSAAPGNGDLAAGLDNGGGGGDIIPLFRVDPIYPRKAARNRDEGWVKLRFTITELGSVVDPVVVDARPRRTFNRAAVAAIRQWRFKPRVVAGKPVAVQATQVIEFKLAGR